MHIMGISVSDLRYYGVSNNAYLCYKYVWNVMTRSDLPASELRVVHKGAQLRAFSFDLMVYDSIRAYGQEWTKMFFVPVTS